MSPGIATLPRVDYGFRHQLFSGDFQDPFRAEFDRPFLDHIAGTVDNKRILQHRGHRITPPGYPCFMHVVQSAAGGAASEGKS